MPKNVLLAFDDPGGGLVVTALIDSLSANKKLYLHIYSGKLSEKFLKEKKINFNKLDSILSSAEAKKIINKVDPDIIVTGTSGGSAEQELRNIAFTKRIKSVVILDFWKDYSRRWLYATYHIAEMKDTVCVMDDEVRKEMLKENFPKNNLIVTGQPYLDRLFNAPEEKHTQTDANNILFLSQPLNVIGITNYKVHPLEILLQALTKLSQKQKKKINLSIKLHPGEKLSTEIKKIATEFINEILEIKIESGNRKLDDLMKNASVVIGYNTIAMFEARAMNKRTISLNVVPVRESLSKAMNTAGIEIVKADEKEIYKCLSENKILKTKKNIFKGGVDNCVRIILSSIKLN